ncbi:MAG: glycosyltransferase family 39 protein [Nitrospirota bacterium]
MKTELTMDDITYRPSCELKKNDFLPIGVILLYCLAYASIRLLISPSMELDEAEQFLKGFALSLGYSNQPPLYSWIVKIVSMGFGLNIITLVAVKYCLIFFFYIAFYHTVRSVWNVKESLLITGSLLVFPSFAYEFNRDLSHTVLATLMASLTCLIYFRLLKKRKTLFYLLIGGTVGLGVLSKYNFVFFAAALVLASVSFREGRRVLFDRRSILAIAICCLVLLPHLLWLKENNFLPFSYAMSESGAGAVRSCISIETLSLLASSYSGVLIFILVFGIFFRRHVFLEVKEADPEMRAFRWIALYGMAIPLIVILNLRTAHFSERWLAPVLFTLPPALFSITGLAVNNKRSKVFGLFCIFIAFGVIAARVLIGFMPDTVGKVERIHIPFREISLQLAAALRQEGIHDFRQVAVISDSEHIAANLMVWMPGTKFVPFQSVHPPQGSDLRKNMVIVWNASKRGRDIPKEFADRFPAAVPLRPIEAPFIRAKKFPPYILGAAIIPHRQAL